MQAAGVCYAGETLFALQHNPATNHSNVFYKEYTLETVA